MSTCATATDLPPSNRPRITISITAPDETADGELLTLDLPSGLTLADLRASVQAETTFPESALHFYLNGQPLVNNSQTLEDAGIKDGEMLAMLVNRATAPGQRQTQQRRPANRRQADAEANAESIRLQVLGNPQAEARLRADNPELGAALNDQARWRELYVQAHQQQAERERERQRQIALLNEDPFNVEAQRKIEEMIRQDNVMENIQHAFENHPEGMWDMFYDMRLMDSRLQCSVGLSCSTSTPRSTVIR